MTLFEAQKSIVETLVPLVTTTWGCPVVYTDQPILPPTSERGERPLPEGYVNVAQVALDRPEQQRMTATCLDLAPVESVRLDIEVALRELKPTGEPLRLQQARQAQAIRSAVLMDGSSRRLFAGVPAYWTEESYQPEELDLEPLADDCLLRVRFYFVVSVALA